jgi:hypothetical protein
MYYIQDAHSFWNWIYFVFLIVVSDRFILFSSNASSFETRNVLNYFLFHQDRLVFYDKFVPSRHSDPVLGDEKARDRAHDSREATLLPLNELAPQRHGTRAWLVLGGVP